MRRGFISSYYLIVFLITAGLLAGILLNVENRLKTAGNITRVNMYLGYEECVIKGLKCALMNDSLETGGYTWNGVVCTVEAYEKQAYITISEPVYEVLYVTYDRDKKTVYDYEVIRYETVF